MMKYSLAVMVVCIAVYFGAYGIKAPHVKMSIIELKVPSNKGGPEAGPLTIMSTRSDQVAGAKRKGSYFDLFPWKRTTLYAHNTVSLNKAPLPGASSSSGFKV